MASRKSAASTRRGADIGGLAPWGGKVGGDPSDDAAAAVDFYPYTRVLFAAALIALAVTIASAKGAPPAPAGSTAAPDQSRRARGWCTPRVSSTRQRHK
jgi:hypothetical protein